MVGLNVNLQIVGPSQETTKLFIFQNMWFLCLWTAVISQATPLYLSVCLSLIVCMLLLSCHPLLWSWLWQNIVATRHFFCNLPDKIKDMNSLSDWQFLSQICGGEGIWLDDNRMIGLMINMVLIHILIYLCWKQRDVISRVPEQVVRQRSVTCSGLPNDLQPMSILFVINYVCSLRF